MLPPPMTSTFLPIIIGVSVSGLAASIRLTRVRYSLLDRILMAFSPGIPMKLGNPAPEPTKIPLKPFAFSSSIEMVLPMMVSVWKCTPSRRRLSISTSTILFGRRNSGIPYFRTPPISCSASKTYTSYPRFTMSPAKLKPDGPEPTTATLMPLDGATSGNATCPLSRS